MELNCSDVDNATTYESGFSRVLLKLCISILVDERSQEGCFQGSSICTNNVILGLSTTRTPFIKNSNSISAFGSGISKVSLHQRIFLSRFDFSRAIFPWYTIWG